MNTDPKARPSTDDVWHDRPDGPTLILKLDGLSPEAAKAIVDAHNATVRAVSDHMASCRALLGVPNDEVLYDAIAALRAKVEKQEQDTRALRLFLSEALNIFAERNVETSPTWISAATDLASAPQPEGAEQ